MTQLVIGLGNPGGEYAGTRHNAGWMCLDVLEARGKFAREKREGPARIRSGSIDGFDLVTARPQTFMNLSGKAGIHLVNKFGVDPRDVIVIHDDIDLSLGRLRVRRGGSAAGQKGVESLIATWRTPDFVRVRIGVGRPGDGDDVVDHVLDRFKPDEREIIKGVVERGAEAVVSLVQRGLEPTMAEYNRVPAM